MSSASVKPGRTRKASIHALHSLVRSTIAKLPGKPCSRALTAAIQHTHIYLHYQILEHTTHNEEYIIHDTQYRTNNKQHEPKNTQPKIQKTHEQDAAQTHNP